MIDMLNDTRFTYSDERDTAKWTWRGSPAPRSEACGGWRPWVEVFVTAAELIDDLSAAFRSGRLADALAAYTHPAVLVGDEVGYLTCGTDAANMLFHVVNDRHRKKRSTIFTTNKQLNAWGGSSMMTTSPRPSSIASSNAVGCLRSMALHTDQASRT